MSTRSAAAVHAVVALLLAACSTRSSQTPQAAKSTIQPTNAAQSSTATATEAQATATVSPAPRPTVTPTPTSTPAPVLRRLTGGGCCVQPNWSPDGREVWFLDRPSAADPSGMWAVPAEGGEPRFLTDRLGLYSPDHRLFAYPEGNLTYIERVSGERWSVPAGGRPIAFSPDASRIAWQVSSSSVNFDRRLVEIRVANVDGSEAQTVATLRGGGLVAWLPDGNHMLVSLRDEADRASAYARLSLADGSLTPLVEGVQLRGGLLSPAGGWLAYQVAFSGDSAADGLWVVSLDGTPARKLALYGAYRWREEGRLLVLPLEPGAAAQRLVEVDALTGAARPLTDPAVTPLRIAGGDWALSPDGDMVAFVSAADRNIWILELQE